MACVVLGFLSCTDELLIDTPIQQEEDIAIHIDGSISQRYTTRVDDGGFCDGDRIGLYGVNYTNNNSQPGTLLDEGNQVDNAMYTFDEANWKWVSSGSIYYKDANTNIDLYGYYPYGSPESVSTYAFEVEQDQSGANAIDGYEVSDFLWGKAENIAPTDQKIKIRFNHRMACANVVLKEGEGFVEGEFDSLDKSLLVMNTTRTSTINLATGEVTATGKAASEGIVMKENADGFRAIVVPQTVDAGISLFAITIDGVSYRFKKDAAFTYEAGKQSKFTIEVSKKVPSGEYEFTLVDCEIVDWIADLSSHGGEARQYYVVHCDEPGTLAQKIAEDGKDAAKIKNLKVSGKINAQDFYFMRDAMSILQSINLKECEVGVIYAGDWYRSDEIPSDAFLFKSTLVNFVFPEMVTKIGQNAFYGTLLSGALVIPEDVVEIGAAAFMGTNISSLQLSPNLKVLSNDVFSGCSSLSGSLSLPESLESIGISCFGGCGMLSGNLILPSGLKEIGVGCFSSCGFVGDLVIPNGVTTIGDLAFYNVPFDGKLYLPDGLKNIGYSAFDGCIFQGELYIPSGVQFLERYCFSSNEFSSIVFAPNSELIKIGEWVFYNNWRLSEPMVLPEGLLTIASEAFSYCSSMPAITIPSTVTTIGANAFNGCYYITQMQCDATMPPVVGSGAFDGIGKDNLTLEVPEQSVPLYQTAGGWGDFKRISAHHDFSISRRLLRTLNAEHTNTYVLRVPLGEPWSVESCPEWVTVSPSSGVGRTEVTVTVSEMARTTETFTFEEMDQWGNWSTETHTGRAGDIVFLLDNKDYRSTMVVQQYDSERRDGEVIVNQTASVGGGVNLVFMGDCFDARDIAMGSYLEGINEAIGYYFAIEPYKSYRDYFNVYTVVGMSYDSGVGTLNTIKDAKFGSQYSLGGIAPDVEITYDYAMKSPTVNEGNINQTLVVMIENTTDYGGVCYMYVDGSAIAVCPMSRDAYPFDFRGIVQHEAGGHGFAKLGDEYIYTNAFISTCRCKNPHLDEFNFCKAILGWYRNLSTNSDMKTVEWAHLYSHPDYSDIVDMYEGGYFHTRGMYRSEANSCMNNNVPYYSAIQRQEMVERIMRYAGLEFDINDFYARDVRDASNNDFVTRATIEVDDTPAMRAAAAKQMPPKILGEKPQLKCINQ